MAFRQAVATFDMAGDLIAGDMLLHSVAQAQDAKIKTAMELLQSTADKLGPPKIDGTDSVAGKQVRAIFLARQR
jgi:hypothetical protein